MLLLLLLLLGTTHSGDGDDVGFPSFPTTALDWAGAAKAVRTMRRAGRWAVQRSDNGGPGRRLSSSRRDGC